VADDTPARRREEASGFGDPTRRTYLAQERTLLAWWRTGLATLALALAVGRVIPGVSHVPAAPYVAVGILFAVLGAAFVLYGAYRDRLLQRSFREGAYLPFPRSALIVFTVGMLAVSAGAVIVMIVAD
jgi:putative membrane protein